MSTSPVGSGYRFNYADAGTLVELYFPKKAAYQGPLYGALWEGLRPGAVERHLRANENRQAILDLLPEEISVRFEELIEGASWLAWRRVNTFIRLPAISAKRSTQQMVPIDQADLDAALAKDKERASGRS